MTDRRAAEPSESEDSLDGLPLAPETDWQAPDANFLLRLSDTLVGLSRPSEVIAATVELLARRLRVPRVHYLEFDGGSSRFAFLGPPQDESEQRRLHEEASASLPASAVAVLAEGRPLVVENVADSESLGDEEKRTLAGLGAGALLAAPVFEEERLVAAVIVLDDEAAAWQPQTVTLVEEIGRRCRRLLERIRGFRNLEERRARYQALFESMDQGFFVAEVHVDEDGRPNDYRFLEVNPVFAELTGLKDAAGKLVSEIVPDLEPHWFEAYGQVALTGVPRRFEASSAALAGRWFDVYAFRLGGDESRKIAVLFSNISEQKQYEYERDRLMMAVELERSRLQEVFEKAPALIATLRGPEHTFEMANPLFRQFFGHRQLIGVPVREALPEVSPDSYELLDIVFSTGKAYVGRAVPIQALNRGRLNERLVDFVYQPMHEPDGSISGIFVHAVDVTEHKRAEEALARAHDQLELRVEERTAELRKLNEELESFNYSVSHDLRSPLRGIDGFSQLLAEDYGQLLDETGQHYLQRIRAATSRMGQLIDDLLGLSRITRAEIELSRIDLSALAREIGEELIEGAQDRDITLTVASGMEACGDAALVRIVLENLLGNAIKFTKREKSVLIEVGSFEGEEGQRVFFVRDNGIGFSNEYADRIFQPFQRLQGNSAYEGTGIGLATVQRVIDKHGGKVWAQSEPGSGATFLFTLAPP